MKALRQDMIEQWCGERGFVLASNARFLCGGRAGTVQLQRYGGDGGGAEEVAQVAGDILAALGRWDECLVWITLPDGDALPESRARHPSQSDTTELHSLEAHPGRLFDATERWHLSELLYWVLETGRDVHVLPARQARHIGVSLFIAHDGWLELNSS